MREKPGANIMIGAYWAESMQLAETGSRVGAMQISGTAQTSQIPFFLVSTDYCLIGEEIYAAGAYLTNEAPLIASLAGQDVRQDTRRDTRHPRGAADDGNDRRGNPLLTVNVLVII